MARKRRGPSRDAKVFISHSSRDRVFVEKVVTVLRGHRIAYWYAPKNIVGAQQWQDEIGRALRECNWFLLVLSENARRAKWVKRELAYALENNRYNERILSIVKQQGDYTTLSWTLSSFQQVDFTGGFETACIDLLRVWGIEYHPE
jgi:hypothetical protein